MKKLSLIAILVVTTIASIAQDRREAKEERKELRRQKINEMVRQAEEGVLVYEKQSVFGVQLRTNGYGAFYEYGRMKTNRKTNIFRLDITEVKHPKEEKLINTNAFFSNPIIYGKINNFYPVTLGVGQQLMLGQKGNKNGVAVSAVYNAGLALGLLRPYYLEVDIPGVGQKSIKYEDDSTTFLDQSAIISASGLGKGWGDIKVKPGAFVKGALRFDYGRFNETVTALEIGMSVEGYASKIQQMAYQKDSRLFYQIYLAFVFGKRK